VAESLVAVPGVAFGILEIHVKLIEVQAEKILRYLLISLCR